MIATATRTLTADQKIAKARRSIRDLGCKSLVTGIDGNRDMPTVLMVGTIADMIGLFSGQFGEQRREGRDVIYSFVVRGVAYEVIRTF